MIRGGCLCGSIRYEVRGPVGRVNNCHCIMCRKAHGAAFVTYGRVKAEDFVLLSGADDLGSYQSSEPVTRTFCKKCGSSLQFIVAEWLEIFGLALGTLDDDPCVRPSKHIFVDFKAPWFDIIYDLPNARSRSLPNPMADDFCGARSVFASPCCNASGANLNNATAQTSPIGSGYATAWFQ